jgi:hypothetical protein
MFDAVTCAIANAKRPAQVEEPMGASLLQHLGEEQMAVVCRIYDKYIRQAVHDRW